MEFNKPARDFCRKNVQSCKVVHSGRLARLIEVIPHTPNENRKNTLRKKKKQEPDKDCGRFTSSLYRSRSKVREHMWNNFVNGSLFITLTYKENFGQEYYDESLVHFDLFIKKLRKKYKDIRYLAVAELQKRGAIHFHIIVDRKFIDHNFLDAAWEHGFVFVKRTYGKPSKIANYVTKYITKETIVKVGRKSYLASRNLKKSIVVKGEWEPYEYMTNLLSMTNFEKISESYFETDFARINITSYEILE